MSDVRPEEALDVRILSQQDLPDEVFPGGRSEAFRVFLSPAAHAAIWKHALETTSVEICGVLVGTWQRDGAGPYVKVTESIRGEGAETRFAEVTFTHQTWAKINAEMDTKFSHLKIVGWYHTHPDFGIFLSDRDRFIQEHFFSGPGQIALVVDPVRNKEGVFIWRGGKPAPGEHYWVGDRIIMGESAAGEAATEKRSTAEGSEAGSTSSSNAGTTQPVAPLGPGLASLLIYVAFFLMGYVLASLRSGWEQRTLAEGAVAHFGLWSILRPGLPEELDRLGRDLVSVERPLESLKQSDQNQDRALAEVRSQLAALAARIAALKSRYGYTPAEEALLRQMLTEKLAEINLGPQARPNPELKGTIAPSGQPGAAEPPKPGAQTAPGAASPSSEPAKEKAGARAGPDGKPSTR
jgi:proteasome lid subunit RPN8/RPN11